MLTSFTYIGVFSVEVHLFLLDVGHELKLVDLFHHFSNDSIVDLVQCFVVLAKVKHHRWLVMGMERRGHQQVHVLEKVSEPYGGGGRMGETNNQYLIFLLRFFLGFDELCLAALASHMASQAKKSFWFDRLN